MKVAPLAIVLIAMLLAWTIACETGLTGATGPARVIFRSTGGDGEATLEVEVARSAEERAQGLMSHKQLGPDNGMIFVWDSPVQRGFWMKDTAIPLSIAFIAEDGTIIDIQEMQPFSTKQHMPASEYVYAVEANQGWFSDHGINVGGSAQFSES